MNEALASPAAAEVAPAPAGRAVAAWLIACAALVAGIRAGKADNTFPLMNGHLVPPETFMLEPFWLNFVSNVATVQLDHRLLAWVLLLLVPWLWLRVRRSGVSRAARLGADSLLGLVALQFGLGVATLLAAVPVGLAAAHQGVATLVFAAALFTAHALRPAR